jgi:hypothetical protein
VLLRRGRNNRLLAKFIHKSVFEEENTHELDEDGKTASKKRKKIYYNDPLAYLNREFPDQAQLFEYCSRLRDKKFLSKHMKKSAVL